MKGFTANIEEWTERNRDFRQVLYTGTYMQLVVMTLQRGEEIGEETHEATDQFICVEEGKGEIWMDGMQNWIGAESAVFVPAGTRLNVRNAGTRALKFYTLYAPPKLPGE